MPSVEQKRAYRAKYREKNKEAINQAKKVKAVCECGSEFTKVHKSRHINTKKHQAFLELTTTTN